MDKVKNYDYYFKHNNILVLAEQINSIEEVKRLSTMNKIP